MRIKNVIAALSLFIKYLATVFIIPLLVALYYRDFQSLFAFGITIIVMFLFGILLNSGDDRVGLVDDFKKQEALATLVLFWVSTSIIFAIPYLFYGFSPINSFFEAVSGITTTGATILTDFSIYPKSLFFWRGYSQWVGGMGVIILVIAVLPQFAIAGRQMFAADSPGPEDGKFTPRIKSTALLLGKLYIFLTVILVILLKCAGMPLFDAMCNAFSTISCAGFSPNQASIIGYDKSVFVWIIAAFMFISGTGFAMTYRLIQKRDLSLLSKNDEFKVYLGLTVAFSIFIAIILYTQHTYTIGKAIEEGVFQSISIVTTTGFATVDYTIWPHFAKIALFMLFFTGACAGSTSGGLKIIRLLLVLKYIKREIAKILHPSAVIPIRVNDIPIPNDIISQTVSFVIFYFMVFAITAFLVTLTENSFTIGITGAIATLGNVGPAFSVIGPMGSYDSMCFATKIIFIFNMLLGRLELIPFLAMLNKDFYNFKR